MMIVPLELPLRASEAASLADLILQMGEGRPLADDTRNRILARLPSLGLETIRPYMGSLVKDPTHGSTYYLAVDATSAAGVTKPFLLHMALSSAPASANFLKPILIGRMRPAGGREIVVNAIPFGPEDISEVLTYSEKLERGFLPRPQTGIPSISITTGDAATDLPAAFEAYRTIQQQLRVNLAAPVRVDDGVAESEALDNYYAAGVWAAIRSGWRDGYTMEVCFKLMDDSPEQLASIKTGIRKASAFTKFSLDVTALLAIADHTRFETLFDEVERSWILEEFAREFPLVTGTAIRFTHEETKQLAVRHAAAMRAVEQLYDEIRREKSRSITGRTFDFELKSGSPGSPVSPKEMLFAMHWLKSQGRTIQLLAPYIATSNVVSETEQFSAVARYFQAILTLAPGDDLGSAVIEQIGRATSGRVNFQLTQPHDADFIVALATRLRG